MKIEFDPAKDAANREKHGLPLVFGARIFDDLDALILPTIRKEDEEERHKVIGMLTTNFIPPCWFGVGKRPGSFR